MKPSPARCSSNSFETRLPQNDSIWSGSSTPTRTRRFAAGARCDRRRSMWRPRAPFRPRHPGAGTIAGRGNNGVGVTGVNWNASIMAAKFLDATGTGSTSDAINAIEFAIQAKNAFAAGAGANVRVLSNSWGGGGFSQGLLDEINK